MSISKEYLIGRVGVIGTIYCYRRLARRVKGSSPKNSAIIYLLSHVFSILYFYFYQKDSEGR